MNLLETVQLLSRTVGTSGGEQAVREQIRALLPANAESRTDAMGDLLVRIKGKERAKNTVLVEAHMDEVGFIVTYIGANGLLRFSAVGGISRSVLCGKRVVFENGVKGVIGVVPIHLLEPDKKRDLPEPDDLYIDIGAPDRETAETLVSVGDTAVFASEPILFGDHKIKGKALDDRAGCAMLLAVMHSELLYDTQFAFSVQEEVGTRGAAAVAFAVRPDYAIVAETTTAADISSAKPHQKVCFLGKGPAISFMDRSTVYDPAVYRLAAETAEKNGIPYQFKTVVAGGNDSGAIHKSGGGVKTLSVSLPCRYLHSPACILDTRDIEAGARLIRAAAEAFANA